MTKKKHKNKDLSLSLKLPKAAARVLLKIALQILG